MQLFVTLLIFEFIILYIQHHKVYLSLKTETFWLCFTFSLPDGHVSFLIRALLPPVLLPVAHWRRLARVFPREGAGGAFEGIWQVGQKVKRQSGFSQRSSGHIFNLEYVPTLCALVDNEEGQRWRARSPPWGDKPPDERSSTTERVAGHNWGTERQKKRRIKTQHLVLNDKRISWVSFQEVSVQLWELRSVLASVTHLFHLYWCYQQPSALYSARWLQVQTPGEQVRGPQERRLSGDVSQGL